MQPIGKLLASREPTALEREAIEELTAYAQRYRDSGRDRFTLTEIIRSCPSKQTTLIRFVAGGTDQHRMILDLIEDWCMYNPVSPMVFAVNGTHHQDEIAQKHGRVRRLADGRKFIEWPTGWVVTQDQYGRPDHQPLYDPGLIPAPPDFGGGRTYQAGDRMWWEEGSRYEQVEIDGEDGRG